MTKSTPLEQKLWPFLLIGLVFSLFWNLGLPAFYNEEPRRALIALEMLLRNDWLAPTEFGIQYCKKPPVYNWLIMVGYKLTGIYTEWWPRCITVISLLLMGVLHFRITKHYISKRQAFYSAIFFIISADIYFGFSKLGEIDLFYSLITYAAMLLTFHLGQKQKYWALFLITYLITAIGTLTKGVPSPVFQGLTLLTYFIWSGKWKKLLSPAHFAGIGLFAIIVGGYAYLYSQHNDITCYLNDLWSQSSERTVLEKSIWDTVKGFFIFPLDLLRITLPAAIFLPLLFLKDVRQAIWQNKFLQFALIVFAVNVLPYWVSPGSRPRYIYMLLPLVITVAIFAFSSIHKKPIANWFDAIAMFACGGVSVAFVWGGVFLAGRAIVPSPMIVLILGAVLPVIIAFIVKRIGILFGIVCLFLLCRILVVDAMAQQFMVKKGEHVEYYNQAITISEIAGNEQVLIYTPWDDQSVSRSLGFYITRETGHITQMTQETNCENYYLVKEHFIPELPYDTFHSFESRMGKYVLLKFTHCDDADG